MYVYSAATGFRLYAKSIPKTSKVLLRFSFHFPAQCPKGARGLSPGFQPWEACAMRRRALKGRKRGLVPRRSLNEIMFMSVAISNLPPLPGRFVIILRVPRVETLG